MKHLIFLLLPIVGWGQSAKTIRRLAGGAANSTVFDTIKPIPNEGNLKWKELKTVRWNTPEFVRIDTVKGVVEYLVAVDSVTYEKKIADGYKIDSVFREIRNVSPPPDENGNLKLVLGYQITESRTTFRIIANGREINRYKYYTFIPKP